ncbi:hypothetical protein GCM10022254_59090 [Actinomadura meridiana]|uniref:Uncharacterized protein n=1 Tax=Actinomadura meridiana TaxID=559626 RepID=A0ABP8CI11_9ACTN
MDPKVSCLLGVLWADVCLGWIALQVETWESYRGMVGGYDICGVANSQDPP